MYSFEFTGSGLVHWGLGLTGVATCKHVSVIMVRGLGSLRFSVGDRLGLQLNLRLLQPHTSV